MKESTNKDIAPHQSMVELSSALPCLIHAAATTDKTKGPVLFAKFDIKDGYWRMAVPDNDMWNFAYILPKLDPDEPT